MKKLLLLAAMAMLPYLSQAQTSTRPLTDTTAYPIAEQYCIVTPTRGLFDLKYGLDVDYGQDPSADKRLHDDRSKDLKFNSLAQALNHMAYQGWVFVNTLKTEGQEYPGYLLRRPAKQTAATIVGN